MAKLYTARMACEVTDECLQIHGGAGYMKEYGIERAWRDMRLNRIGAGTDEVMLDVIGRSYGLCSAYDRGARNRGRAQTRFGTVHPVSCRASRCRRVLVTAW